MDQNEQSESDVAAAIQGRMVEIGLDEDEEAARDVLDQFVETVAAYRDAALEALRTGDLEALAQAAHKLAGTAVTLGAAELGRQASRLEGDAQAGRSATLRVQLEELGRSVETVLAASRTLRAALG